MKKLFAAMMTVFIIAFCGNLQAQCLEKGNIVIDAYYGFPNLYSTVLKVAFASSGTDVKTGNMGPLGIKGEYLLGGKIGVGLDISYASSSIEWEEQDFNTLQTYTYKVSIPRIGVMPRFYFHFLNKDAFEMYASAAIGYKTTKLKFETDDPNYTWATWSATPLGYRTALGCRLFFSDNIGLNFEFGIGGALLTGGLAAKF